MMENVRAELKKIDNPNTIDYGELGADATKRLGYVETVLRVEIVDARRLASRTRETLLFTSDVAFEAGVLSSGYEQVIRELRDAREEIADMVQVQGIAPASPPVIVQGWITGNLRKDLVNKIAGVNVPKYAPSIKATNILLQDLALRVQTQLTKLMEETKRRAARATPDPSKGEVARAVRRLPQRVRVRNATALTLVLEHQDAGVAVAPLREAAGTTGTEKGSQTATQGAHVLRDIVQSSSRTMRILRQAVDQFLEIDGLYRPRVRFFVSVGKFPSSSLAFGSLSGIRKLLPDHSSNENDDDDGAPSGVSSRLVYAPRMPAAVVGALESRAEHAHVAERLAIAWLNSAPNSTPRSGASVARAFRLPPTHESELIVGVVVDLAIEDTLARVRRRRDTKADDDDDASQWVLTPHYGQVVESALVQAVRRVRQAGELATSVVDSMRDTARPRMDKDDAFFDCFPGGRVLAMLLNESAVWRTWRQPWRVELAPAVVKLAATAAAAVLPRRLTSVGPRRFDALAAAAAATPRGIDMLVALLQNARAVRVPAKGKAPPLTSMPFLSVQTLVWHCDAVLALDGVVREVGFGTRERLAMLTQINHARQALRRIDALATGQSLGQFSIAMLLLEAAWARPVLELVASDAERGDAVAELINDPLLMSEEYGVQPSAPLRPNEAQRLPLNQPSMLSWLRKRLAAYRLPTESALPELRHSAKEASSDEEEEAEEGEASVLVQFENHSQSNAIHYLLPFAGATVREVAPTMSRAFEEAPVFTAVLRETLAQMKTSSSSSKAAASSAAAATVVLAARRSDDSSKDLHPFVAVWSEEEEAEEDESGERKEKSRGISVAIADAATVAAPRATEESTLLRLLRPDDRTTTTLRACAAAAAAVRAKLPALLGRGVDAAAAFVHNVERVMQAFLIVAAKGRADDEAAATVLSARPPPPPPSKLIPEPQPIFDDGDKDPVLVRLEQALAVSLLALVRDTEGRDKGITEMDELVAKKFGRLTYIDDVDRVPRAGLVEASVSVFGIDLKEPDPNSMREVFKNDFGQFVAGSPNPKADPLPWLQTLRALLKANKLEKPEEKEQLIKKFRAAWRPSQDREFAARAAFFLDSLKKARDGRKKRRAAREEEIQKTKKDNDERRAIAKQERALMLRQWGMTCAVAQALTVNVLLSPCAVRAEPRTDIEAAVAAEERALIDDGVDALSAAVKQWEERELRVVPLAELAAVLVRA